MIQSIKITNPLNESLELILSEPDKSGFIIRSVEGLGPVKADVHMTELATLDGSMDNSARLGTRNIVFSLLFLGTPTIEDTRLKSYRYFPIKQNVTIEITTDNRKCYTIGRVESNTPNIFDRDEGCQISIICPNSYFMASENTSIDFYSQEPLFEFPFENNSLTSKLIEFGNIQRNMAYSIFYTGDADTGFVMEIHSIGNVNGIGVYRFDSNEKMIISDTKLKKITGDTIRSGDTIYINTNKGSKSIHLLKNGVYYNILNALEAPISWFQIRRGDNGFTIATDSGSEYLQYRVDYNILYEGV